MKENLHLTKKQIKLLSAYLDDQLSKKERQKVETLFSANPHAVQYLENLRKLKSLLRMLPARKVPHQYILTRQEVENNSYGWVAKGFGILSGVSAVALAVVLAFDLLMPLPTTSQFLRQENAKLEESPAMESLAAPESDLESISPEPGNPTIFSFQPAPQGYGLGGGDNLDGELADMPGMILPDISINEGETIPNLSATLTQADEDALEMESGETYAKSQVDAGPILGVRPLEQQGQIIAKEIPKPIQQVNPSQTKSRLSKIGLEIGLLSLTIISALAAVVIHRRRRIKR